MIGMGNETREPERLRGSGEAGLVAVCSTRGARGPPPPREIAGKPGRRTGGASRETPTRSYPADSPRSTPPSGWAGMCARGHRPDPSPNRRSSSRSAPAGVIRAARGRVSCCLRLVGVPDISTHFLRRGAFRLRAGRDRIEDRARSRRWLKQKRGQDPHGFRVAEAKLGFGTPINDVRHHVETHAAPFAADPVEMGLIAEGGIDRHLSCL